MARAPPASRCWRCSAAPQAYVSPSWYPTKAEHHKVVPTWNYAVVHAHGTLRAVDDAAWLRALVTRLTGQPRGGAGHALGRDDAPAEAYVQQMLRAIVGIEISCRRGCTASGS